MDEPQSLLWWSEPLVEEIAEACLEHVELDIGDRHRVRPIVRDGPSRDVVLRRPVGTRPRLDRNVKVIGQDAQDGTSKHPDRIALHASEMNGRSLSRSVLPPPGRLAASVDGGFLIDMIDVLSKRMARAF